MAVSLTNRAGSRLSGTWEPAEYAAESRASGVARVGVGSAAGVQEARRLPCGTLEVRRVYWSAPDRKDTAMQWTPRRVAAATAVAAIVLIGGAGWAAAQDSPTTTAPDDDTTETTPPDDRDRGDGRDDGSRSEPPSGSREDCPERDGSGDQGSSDSGSSDDTGETEGSSTEGSSTEAAVLMT
jgi:hypothetical protein